MDRTQSAPGMARSLSTIALNSSDLQRTSTTYSDSQLQSPETASGYSLYSDSTMRHQSMLQPIEEAPCFTDSGMVEYSVDDYVSSYMEPSSSLSIPIPHYSQQLTPHQWYSSSDVSTSPSSPSTAQMTPVTQASNAMSRQGSYNPNFVDTVSMLRVQSDSSSSMYPILSEDGPFPYSYKSESKTISQTDGSHFSALTGHLTSEPFLSSTNFISASAQTLASFDNEQLDLAEDMRRSASASSSESNGSDASAPSSTYSRQSRREREINVQASSRKIAPKAVELNETESLTSNAQMKRIQSEDGSSRTVGLLTKTPYVRPSHPKILCQFCDERPDGFRGTHELERHYSRAHAPTRKGYICIDASSDQKYLASCKHCRGKKVYGAYYNAAAHLRRAHFHPRKRGRKNKSDEKRGGIGGGDDPPMEFLKQHWIKEIEVANKPSAKTSETTSDDASETVDSSYDASNSYGNMAATYTQQQTSMSINTSTHVSPAQYSDEFGMSMSASEPLMYDDTAFATSYDPNMAVPNDINNFQFDADVYPS